MTISGGEKVIFLTKKDKDGTSFLLNHHMIERIIPLKDTIILLENGKKIIVNEGPDEIVEKIMEFEAEVAFRAQKKKDVTEL